MYDAHGKEYLDFAAGIAVNALGELQPYDVCRERRQVAYPGIKNLSLKVMETVGG